MRSRHEFPRRAPSRRRMMWNSPAAVERLEPRRLLAAWTMGPLFDGGELTYYYHLDERGYHWEAEIGETGQSKTYEYGRLFRAEYDESVPAYEGGAEPDRAEFYASLLSRLTREYAWRMQYHPVEFSIVEHGGGVFEVVATPTAPPTGVMPTLAPADDAEQVVGKTSDQADSTTLMWHIGLMEFDERVVADEPRAAPAPVPEPAAQQTPPFAAPGRPSFSAWSDALVCDDRDDELAPPIDGR